MWLVRAVYTALVAVAVLALAGFALSDPARSAPRIESPSSATLGAPITIQLDAIPQGSLVTMLLRDVMRVPYVIAPDVLQDRRPISVNLVIPRNQVPERVVQFLRKNSLSVELVGGTIYVGRKGSGFAPGAGLEGPQTATQLVQASPAVPMGSPLSPALPAAPAASYAPSYPAPDPEPVEAPGELLVYDPAHRDPDYLSSVVLAVLPSLKVGSRSGVKAEVSENVINGPAAADLLVMIGPEPDLDRARRLISQLDRPRPIVAVKAVVMQVSDIQARGSALSVLASIAGAKVELGSFNGLESASQFVRVSTGAVKAMLTAVREDSRFKVVASPNLSALSGSTAVINAGSQVPTIGSVAVAEGGAVQSVVYRDSGITLSVRPTVRGQVIELDVRQERSTFVRTTTGVEDSPTLQKATAQAQLLLRSGESVVLAGLTEESDGNTREGLLGGLLGVRKRDRSSSELLVVIQAELVPVPSVAAGRFIDLDPETEIPEKSEIPKKVDPA